MQDCCPEEMKDKEMGVTGDRGRETEGERDKEGEAERLMEGHRQRGDRQTCRDHALAQHSATSPAGMLPTW